MVDDYGEDSPQFTGSLLFLLDLSRTFSKCNSARDTNSLQILSRELECASLGLAGYYSDDIKIQIKIMLKEIRIEVDKLVRVYEEGEPIQIPEPLLDKLYELEYLLRKIWKDSGLQMSMKLKGQLENW